MKTLIVIVAVLFSSTLIADKTVTMFAVDSKGISKELGQITITSSQYGLVFTPSVTGLSVGLHGFHIHQNPSCQPAMKNGKMVAAAAAGGHYDPKQSGFHGTPWGEGHLGDLPQLYVSADGTASQPVLAPRLKMTDLTGRAIMIHQGGDNHSDTPAALGGGGARVACGVIK
ncbi:MAG: superoxide dismutase family protein [Gammaproteobacteria bacterium]|nr:superoxide dismutase family protein [Gammaproteobacteria bacterium]NNJ73202.1 superoxide dismutase family protein [Enterobacterales bacterium]